MKNLFASFLSFLGMGAASTGSQACVFLFVDEPKCPKNLIK